MYALQILIITITIYNYKYYDYFINKWCINRTSSGEYNVYDVT